MQLILHYISSRLKAINQWRIAHYDKEILALELIYLQVMKKKKASFADALAATSKIIGAHMFLPEFYFLLVGITLLVFTNGAFTEPEVDYGGVLPVLLAATCVLAGALPLALAYITAPFHLLLGASLWFLTGVHAILTALVFSTVQPAFAGIFLDQGIAGFSQLIMPMLLFYGLAEFYMLSRLNNALSFQKYRARHMQPTIESLIPAHKLGTLVSMSAQDHYVEIVTEKGQHLERLTMKKAVELVPEAAGLQVHRSHWVAYGSILSVERFTGRNTIILRNGARLPVGNTKIAEVQAYLDSR